MSDASVLFELLAAEPRRDLLFMLCEAESVSIPDGLRTRGAVQSQHSQGGQPSGGVSVQATSHDRLELELIHTHLPKLEDADVIEWDREQQTVRRGPAFTEIRPVLRMLLTNAETFPSGLF